MEQQLLRKYIFKFYLNGSHSIVINGNMGDVHPHTWEIVLEVVLQRSEFVQFSVYEKVVELFFSRYQNRTLNEVKPFDLIVPTLENMVEYFGEELRKLLRSEGGDLAKIEGSEAPTRSYVISYTKDSQYLTGIRRNSERSVSDILDRMLDSWESGHE